MDMIKILPFIVFAFGVKELYHALEYRKQNKKKWATASVLAGAFACTCAVISMTGIL